MARPVKSGLEYFPHDCDASHDEKIQSLCALYGHHVGYSIIFRLYERIYRGGGKLIVSDAETMQILSRNVADMDVPSFQKVINSCMKLGLLDITFWQNAKILTSKGIISRVDPILSKRMKMKEMYEKNKKNEEGFWRVSAAEMGVETPQSKVKESKYIEKPPPEIKSKKPTPNPTVGRILKYFFDRHLDVRGFKYVVNGGKDGQLITNMLKDLTEEDIQSRIELFLKSDDPFVVQAGFTIGVFMSQINKLKKAAEPEIRCRV